jgi:hypothetical protein
LKNDIKNQQKSQGKNKKLKNKDWIEKNNTWEIGIERLNKINKTFIKGLKVKYQKQRWLNNIFLGRRENKSEKKAH